MKENPNLHVHLTIQQSIRHKIEYFHGDNWRDAIDFITYYDRPAVVTIKMVSVCQRPERWKDIPKDEDNKDRYREGEDY